MNELLTSKEALLIAASLVVAAVGVIGMSASLFKRVMRHSKADEQWWNNLQENRVAESKGIVTDPLVKEMVLKLKSANPDSVK